MVASIYERDDFPILSTTMWEAFEATADHDGDALAVVDGDRRMTRAELHRLSCHLAGALADLGVGRGDHVVLKGTNSVETVAVSLALSRQGIVIVPVPAGYGQLETAYVVDRIRPAAILVTEGLSAAVESDRVFDVADLLARPVAVVPLATPAAVDDVIVVGFTAGTTGRPKGVMHSSASFNYATARWAEVIGLVDGDRILAMLPISYLSGYALTVHMAMTRGLALVCMRRWEIDGAMDLLAEERCAWTMAVTSQVVMMVDASERSGRRLPDIKAMTCGGSPIPEDLVDRARRSLGIEVLRAYGLSECLSAAVMRRDDPLDARSHYDGVPILNTDIETFGESGEILPRGERGICGVRGPSLFMGYFGDHEQTQAAFGPTGFLITGDVAVRDANGYLKIVGRAKDFIIRGGLNIDPVEIEELLRHHPSVNDAAVIGYPDAHLGERICACVTLVDGEGLALDEMTSFLLERGLSRPKVPERLMPLDEIPMSDIGKPLKSKLRELL